MSALLDIQKTCMQLFTQIFWISRSILQCPWCPRSPQGQLDIIDSGEIDWYLKDLNQVTDSKVTTMIPILWKSNTWRWSLSNWSMWLHWIDLMSMNYCNQVKDTKSQRNLMSLVYHQRHVLIFQITPSWFVRIKTLKIVINNLSCHQWRKPIKNWFLLSALHTRVML